MLETLCGVEQDNRYEETAFGCIAQWGMSIVVCPNAEFISSPFFKPFAYASTRHSNTLQ